MIQVMIASFFVLIVLGVPIAFAMGFSALLYFVNTGMSLTMVAQRFFSNTQSFAFLAVPFFCFMGALMVHGGIAEKIVRFADSLVRWLPGGLGCVSVLTNMVMAGVSGSSVADCAAVGSVIVPEMKRAGYHGSFAAALNSAASVVGIIIPPSSTMIIIAYLTNLSVGRMFVAGALPGVLICVSFFIVVIMVSKKRNYPRGTKPTAKEVIAAVKDASWALILPVFLIGSIVLGIATVTESAAISTLYAFILGVFIYKTLDLKKIYASLKETIDSTTSVMMIVCTSTIFVWVLISEGIPKLIGGALLGLGLPNWGLKLMIVLVLLMAGMVMDLVPNLFLFIPILFPIATDIGFDPIHFSIVLLCTLALGLFTPPVGGTLFLSCKIAHEPVTTVTKDLIPFFVASVVTVIIVAFVPQISLTLPALVFGN